MNTEMEQVTTHATSLPFIVQGIETPTPSPTDGLPDC
jgi:hypothetical protein